MIQKDTPCRNDSPILNRYVVRMHIPNNAEVPDLNVFSDLHSTRTMKKNSDTFVEPKPCRQ